VFFGAFLYLIERDNPDEEMASNYNTVPNSMVCPRIGTNVDIFFFSDFLSWFRDMQWMTLLNLSGEAPLAQYSVPGKVAVGLLGLFATAIFGIPIG
jgi:hypothetical protein